MRSPLVLKKLSFLSLFAVCSLGLFSCALQEDPLAPNPASNSFISCFDTGDGVLCIPTANQLITTATDVDGDGVEDPFFCADGVSDSDSDEVGGVSDSDSLSSSSSDIDDNNENEISNADGEASTDLEANSDSDSDSNSDSDSDCDFSISDSQSVSDSISDLDGDGDGDAISDEIDCDCVEGGNGDNNGGDNQVP